MNIQLIIIADEILIGKTKDLNTHTLAKYLRKSSFQLKKVHIIADDELSIKETLSFIHKSGDIAIISGGLGPTQDDKTKNSITSYLNSSLTQNSEALEIVLKQYSRGEREYNTTTHHYHLFPQAAQPLYNPTGFAPGIFHGKNKILFALPGVPHEFESMLNQSVDPILAQYQSQVFNKYLVCKTYGLAESKIFSEFSPTLWKDLEQHAKVSSLPFMGGVDIALTLTANNENELINKENKIREILTKSAIAENILHIGKDLSIEELIIYEAKNKNLKIGSAESCTGGLVASRLTDISGSSSCFWGSVVSYSNDIKINQLNVSETTLMNEGAVSLNTAKEMAMGLLKNLKLDIAVSTTGIAGPNGGSVDKPVGTVCVGIASKDKSYSKIYKFSGNRDLLKLRFSEIALVNLLLEIRSF